MIVDRTLHTQTYRQCVTHTLKHTAYTIECDREKEWVKAKANYYELTTDIICWTSKYTMNITEIESERNTHTKRDKRRRRKKEPRIVLASSMYSYNRTEYINWKNISFLYLVLLIFPEQSLNLRLIIIIIKT